MQNIQNSSQQRREVFLPPLLRFGVGVPKNLPAFSPEEAVAKASEMPGDEVVVPLMAKEMTVTTTHM